MDIYQEKRTEVAGELARNVSKTDNPVKTAHIIIGAFNRGVYSIPLSEFIEYITKQELLMHPFADDETMRKTRDNIKENLIPELYNKKYIVFKDWATEPRVVPGKKFGNNLEECLK